MNCRQGGMAMVVRSSADNYGKVVTCLELVGMDAIVQLSNIRFRLTGGPWWRIDRCLNLTFNDEVFENIFPYARDGALMPIEGDGVKDEEKKEQCA